MFNSLFKNTPKEEVKIIPPVYINSTCVRRITDSLWEVSLVVSDKTEPSDYYTTALPYETVFTTVLTIQDKTREEVDILCKEIRSSFKYPEDMYATYHEIEDET